MYKWRSTVKDMLLLSAAIELLTTLVDLEV
jgi:hypothetical protein